MASSKEGGGEPPRKQPAAREKLEVPLLTPLERRLNVMGAGPDGSKAEKPQIGPVGRSSVLERLQQFLPSMEAANATLQQEMQVKPAEVFDIEHVDEEAQQPYVEMDLACGVLDLLNEDAVAAAEKAMQGQGPDFVLPGVVEDDSDDSDSSDDTDTSDEDDGDVQGQGQMGVQEDVEMQSASEAVGCGDGRQNESPGLQEAGKQQSIRTKLRAKRTNQKIQELT